MHRNMGYAYAEGGERGGAGHGSSGHGPWGNRSERGGLFRHPGELALMILGFVLFWPVGLAALFYFVWRKKMGCNSTGRSWRPDFAFKDQAFSMFQGAGFGSGSGNAAFDDYRQAVMRRLEEERRKLDEEQMAFRAFVDRLRRAKDQEEFDKFMAERNGAADHHSGEGGQPQ